MRRISVTKDHVSKARFYEIVIDTMVGAGFKTFDLIRVNYVLKKELTVDIRKKGKKWPRFSVCFQDHVYEVGKCFEMYISFNRDKDFMTGTGHFYFCER